MGDLSISLRYSTEKIWLGTKTGNKTGETRNEYD
jgi:hypothetical protein